MAIDFAAGLFYESAVPVGTTTYYEFRTTNLVSGVGTQMGSRNLGDVPSGDYFPFEDTEWATGEATSWQNYRFTAPVSGDYIVGCHIMTDNADTGATRWYLQKNGVGGQYGQAETSRSVGRSYMLPQIFLLILNANDYVEPYIVSGTMYGASQAYCRMFGWRLDH